MTRVAINGFGRIGRLTLRAWIESGRDDLDVVAVNDLMPVDTMAHLFAYDSSHGRFDGEVVAGSDSLTVAGRRIAVYQQPAPEKLPWGDLGVDTVLECTGRFATREAAARHLDAGAERVLVSAPAKGAEKTVVFGVNHNAMSADDRVVSNASCTTNCVSPVAAALHGALGIERGSVTTVHAYTGDQSLVDAPHKDLRRARAAGVAIVPTATGAARAVGDVLPALAGKLDGQALRVPTLNVSLVELTVSVGTDTTVEEVNAVLERAADGHVMGISKAPLVSLDFNHRSESSIVDTALTRVVDKRLVSVSAWYDNEWGFANRLLDTSVHWSLVSADAEAVA
ncbi:MAG: type I glyceraldehyde-3-phosphate dehydrogenase [Pseudomonadota bacterium]